MDGKWIEIFKGGAQTDSGGYAQDGDVLIDNALKKFNVKKMAVTFFSIFMMRRTDFEFFLNTYIIFVNFCHQNAGD